MNRDEIKNTAKYLRSKIDSDIISEIVRQDLEESYRISTELSLGDNAHKFLRKAHNYYANPGDEIKK